MINYRTLEDKTIINKNGEEMLDLFSQTFTDRHPSTLCVITVEPDYQSRPDLISLAVYGTDEYADIVCKYNGISNPYELNAGMILVMPYLNETNTIYTELPKQSVLASDASNIVAKEKTFQKKITDMRAPNEQLEGIDNYLLDTNRNLIFY